MVKLFSYIVLAIFFVLVMLFFSNYLTEGFQNSRLMEEELNIIKLYCCDNKPCSTFACEAPQSIIEFNI